MPTYEYECKKCRSRFEIKRGFNETGENICPGCSGEGRRIFSPPALIFKGPGFYITDSRKKADHPDGEEPPAKPAADKPAAGTAPAKPQAESSPAAPPSGSEPVKPEIKPESKA
jgi:putative FmdB family regulatory protein